MTPNPAFVIQVFYSTFYQVGAFLSLLIIFIFCCWNIYGEQVSDGLIGRIMYACVAIACAAGLMHMWEGTYPQRTTITIFVGIALLAARRMFMYYYWSNMRSWYFIHVKRIRAQRKANERSD